MSYNDVRAALTAISSKVAEISSLVDDLEENNTCEPEVPPVVTAIDCLAGIVPSWDSSNLITGELSEVDFVNRRPVIKSAMAAAPNGSICLLGDSMMYQLDASAIAPNAVNMGIPGESTRQFLYRLNDTDANGNPNLLHRAGAGVMLIGINDGRDSYYAGNQADARDTVGGWIYDKIQKWQTGKWVICKLIKVNESGTNASGVTNATYINGVNAYIDTYYANRPGFKVVDINPIVAASGSLSSVYDSGDGLHLNAAGKVVLQNAIKSALQDLNVI